MTPKTKNTTYNGAPEKTDIEFMAEQIVKLSAKKQLRLLGMLIEKNYISEEIKIGYEISGQNCGRDINGIFHCVCGKCKPILYKKCSDGSYCRYNGSNS